MKVLKKDFEKLECKGDCELNLHGYLITWEIVCRKCKGTKKEKDLIDKSYNDFNAREDIINQYDFNEKDKEVLEQEYWY